MAATNQTPFEQLDGVEVSCESLLALRSLDLARNRSYEVPSVDQALDELQHHRDSLTRWDSKAYFAFIGRYRHWSIGVKLSFILLLLGAFAAAAGGRCSSVFYFLWGAAAVRQPFPDAGYHFWWVLTIVLASAVILITVRAITRRPA